MNNFITKIRLLFLFAFLNIWSFSSGQGHSSNADKKPDSNLCNSYTYTGDEINAMDDGYCWKFSIHNVTHDDAIRICMYRTGRLVAVNTVEKAKKLSKYISKYIGAYGGGGDIWLSSATDGYWDTTREKQSSVTAMKPGEDRHGKKCVVFNYRESTWHYTSCNDDQKHEQICEEIGHKYPDEVPSADLTKPLSQKQGQQQVPEYRCNSYIYTRDKINAVDLGYCWRFENFNFTYLIANKMCNLMGGRLLAVNTVEKAKKLSKFIADSGSYKTKIKKVGFYHNDWSGGDEFWLSQATDGYWDTTREIQSSVTAKNPGEDRHGKKCVVFNYRESTWHYTRCSNQSGHAYICEETGHKYPLEAPSDTAGNTSSKNDDNAKKPSTSTSNTDTVGKTSSKNDDGTKKSSTSAPKKDAAGKTSSKNDDGTKKPSASKKDTFGNRSNQNNDGAKSPRTSTSTQVPLTTATSLTTATQVATHTKSVTVHHQTTNDQEENANHQSSGHQLGNKSAKKNDRTETENRITTNAPKETTLQQNSDQKQGGDNSHMWIGQKRTLEDIKLEYYQKQMSLIDVQKECLSNIALLANVWVEKLQSEMMCD